jgi:hypothetical protein
VADGRIAVHYQLQNYQMIYVMDVEKMQNSQIMNKEYIDDLVNRLVQLVNDNLMMRATIQRKMEQIAMLEAKLNNNKLKQ